MIDKEFLEKAIFLCERAYPEAKIYRNLSSDQRIFKADQAWADLHILLTDKKDSL